jgi:rod shape-determining protein MreC
MLKNRYTFAIILLIILFSIKQFTNIESSILEFSNNIKNSYISIVDKIDTTIKTHFNQKQKILELEKKIKILEPLASQSVAFGTKLNDLLQDANLSNYNPNMHLVRVISYKQFNNFNKFWIDFKNFNKNKIYGLIYKGYTAGIVKEENSRALAILQKDKDSIYSVYIGKNKILGIAFGNGENLTIKYIQHNKKIDINDEVTTSGNDGIFYEGIKVGKIIELKQNQLYKSAIVKPYTTAQRAKYFYALDVK